MRSPPVARAPTKGAESGVAHAQTWPVRPSALTTICQLFGSDASAIHMAANSGWSKNGASNGSRGHTPTQAPTARTPVENFSRIGASSTSLSGLGSAATRMASPSQKLQSKSVSEQSRRRTRGPVSLTVI